MTNYKQNKINVNQFNKKLSITIVICILFLFVLVIFLISLNFSKNKKIESERQEAKNFSQELEQKIKNQESYISSLEKEKAGIASSYNSSSTESKNSQKKSSSITTYSSNKNSKTEETEKNILENMKNLDTSFGNVTLTDGDLGI
jgi:biopolymer transport protein ExbB/TolQ